MRLMASGSASAYQAAVLKADGETVVPVRSDKPGRPRGASRTPPAELTNATVEKVRSKGRVWALLQRVIFGTMEAVAATLAVSKVSRTITTAFVERHNATDRHRNARKSRKTYRFSKDDRFHETATE